VLISDHQGKAPALFFAVCPEHTFVLTPAIAQSPARRVASLFVTTLVSPSHLAGADAFVEKRDVKGLIAAVRAIAESRKDTG